MKRGIIFCAVVIMFLVTACSSLEVIGQVYGPEHEYISIGADTYTVCYDSGYSSNDIGERLGIVEFKNQDVDSMMVWSVKDVEDNEYIYTLWVQDGAFYKKDTVDALQQISTEGQTDVETNTRSNMENGSKQNIKTEDDITASDVQILQGKKYIFYKTDMSNLQSTHWIKGGYEEFYQAEFHGLFVGQVLTLFGDENVTDNNEALVSYAVAAENEAGEVIYLEVYYGPSGPAIGGQDGDNYLEAATELEHIIRCTEPKDCKIESVYEDIGVSIIMGTQDGRGFYETIFDESMFFY